jgi:4-amino-4-deoxy-L-arabinose transferase-like glycosyltransferase
MTSQTRNVLHRANLCGRFSLCTSWLDEERHRRAALIGVLVVALALRLITALIIPMEYRFRDDAAAYVSIARHLLTLGVFGPEPGVPYALIPPGYPLFIAGIFALTNYSLIAVRLVQVALGTLMVWLTYLVGGQVTGRRIGLLGALVSAAYPVWVIWPALILTETLYAVLVLIFTWCLVRSMKVCAAQYAALTGVAFGLALLTREALFLFPLLLPFALWWSRVSWRHAWRYLLLFAVAALLVLSPWLIRNGRTFGQVFYTERTEALRYLLTGSGYLSPRYQHMANEAVSPPAPSKPPEYYERYGRQSEWFSINYLLGRPVSYLRQLVNRFVEYWLHPNGLESLPDNLVVRAVYVAVHVGMLGLAGVGLVSGLRRRDVATGIFALLLGYVTGTNLFFTGPNPRYTLPFLPIVFVLAAAGALWLGQTVVSKRWSWQCQRHTNSLQEGRNRW